MHVWRLKKKNVDWWGKEEMMGVGDGVVGEVGERQRKRERRVRG